MIQINEQVRPNNFKRNLRITHSKDYSFVFKNSQRTSKSGVTVLYCKNRHSHGRLGLAIAKKQFKRAVDRNRLKRLIRESFRLSTLRNSQVDVVVMMRAHVIQLDNEGITRLLDKQWKKIQASVGDAL